MACCVPPDALSTDHRSASLSACPRLQAGAADHEESGTISLEITWVPGYEGATEAAKRERWFWERDPTDKEVRKYVEYARKELKKDTAPGEKDTEGLRIYYPPDDPRRPKQTEDDGILMAGASAVASAASAVTSAPKKGMLGMLRAPGKAAGSMKRRLSRRGRGGARDGEHEALATADDDDDEADPMGGDDLERGLTPRMTLEPTPRMQASPPPRPILPWPCLLLPWPSPLSLPVTLP